MSPKPRILGQRWKKQLSLSKGAIWDPNFRVMSDQTQRVPAVPCVVSGAGLAGLF